MLLALLVALLLFSGVISDSCYFPESYTLIPYSDAVSCLKSVELDNDIVTGTLDTLDEIIEMHVFLDILKAPPSPYEDLAIDLKVELNAIRDQTFDNDFDFHHAVSDLFNGLKDPHTLYAKPSAYCNFYFILPLTFQSQNQQGKQVIGTVDLPPDYAWAAWQYRQQLHAQGLDLDDYLDKPLASINGQDPVTWIADWADAEVYYSKSRHARFNRALRYDLWLRQMKNLGIPDSDSILLHFLDGTELDLPFFAFVKKGVTSPLEVSGGDFDQSAELTSLPGAAEGPDGSLVRIGGGDDVSMYRYRGKAGESGHLLVIPSFSPDSMDSYADEIIDCLDAAKADGIDYLVVSVLSNGGGYITSGYRTLRMLAPHTSPVYGNYTMRLGPLVEWAIENTEIGDQLRYDLYDWREYTGSHWYDPGEPTLFTDITGSEYSQTYTEPYAFDVAYDEKPFREAFDRMDNYPGLDIPPNRMAFVTDGLCGSTCACFAKRGRQAGAGLFLGVGGILSEHDTLDMDVASFTGGSVYDTKSLYSHYSSDTPLPPPLPTDAYLRFALEEVHAWDEGEAPLEFQITPVHDWIDLTPAPGQDWQTGSLLTLAALSISALRGVEANSCRNPDTGRTYDWMVEPEPGCNDQFEHAAGGLACLGGLYQESECAQLWCEDGYYPSPADGVCLQREIYEPVKMHISIMWVIVIILAVGGVVALVAVLIHRHRRNSGTEDTKFVLAEEEELEADLLS